MALQAACASAVAGKQKSLCFVALEHDLFKKAGLDVDYSVKYADHDKLEHDVLKRQKEALCEGGSAEAFNVCEWGGIDRLERGSGRGKIAALRPAIAAQAIVSFDPKLQSPRDLAGVAVGINDFTGSHYTTVGLLEGAIPKDEIVTTHIGAPEIRLSAMKEGRVRAVTVMEPFISLALKQGAHIIALTFYRGAEVVSPDLGPLDLDTCFKVLDQAVDLINADFARYAHYIVAIAKDEIGADELDGRFVRYTHAQRYSPELFDPAYHWMKASRTAEAVTSRSSSPDRTGQVQLHFTGDESFERPIHVQCSNGTAAPDEAV